MLCGTDVEVGVGDSFPPLPALLCVSVFILPPRRELKQSLYGRFTFLQKGVFFFLIREAAPRVEGQGFQSVMACFSSASPAWPSLFC